MYQPPHFREERREVLESLIRNHPLATLVTLSPDGLEANHIPMLLDAGRGPLGVLMAHIAKANRSAEAHDQSRDVLAIFQGEDHYITPSWYAAKQEHGKVVPTWNYAVVHAHGRLSVIDDEEWLLSQITALTARHEQPRARPWQVADAPAPFVRAQMKGIVGIEIEITRLEGKWKVSQNRAQADRDGVISGLIAEDGGASRMAALVNERS